MRRLIAIAALGLVTVGVAGCDLPLPPFDDGIPNCQVEIVPDKAAGSYERFVDELGNRYSTIFDCQTGWNPLFRGDPL